MSATAGDYLNITFLDDEKLPKNYLTDHFKTRILPFSDSPLYDVEIVDAKKLTNGEDVNIVYDVTFNVEDIPHEFEPGDTIGILPCNNECEIDNLFKRLNYSSYANQIYSLSINPNTTKKKAAIPSHIPAKGRLQEIFMKCVDVRSVPTKALLRSLKRYTTDPIELESLEVLCSPSGSQQYNEFIIANRSLLKVLEAFPSCYPPVERLLETLPYLKPRPYSISSSPLCNQLRKELHITFAVINIDKNTKGVCTGWLENYVEEFLRNPSGEMVDDVYSVSQGKNIKLYFRKHNNFRLPTVPTTPIIMIGVGTGISPFVGFLEHRFLQPHIEFGTSWLFYGFRYKKRDFLFESKIRQFERSETLGDFFFCSSRDNKNKLYVQDLIIQHSTAFVELIKQKNAIVYVCGSVGDMLKDVKKAIVSCIADVEGVLKEDAEEYLKEMEGSNRYITDAWL